MCSTLKYFSGWTAFWSTKAPHSCLKHDMLPVEIHLESLPFLIRTTLILLKVKVYNKLKYSLRKSARKYHVTSLFTLLRTRFLSDFSFGFEGSNLGRSIWISAYLWFFFFCQIVLHSIKRGQFSPIFTENRSFWRPTKLFLPLLSRNICLPGSFSRNNSFMTLNEAVSASTSKIVFTK